MNELNIAALQTEIDRISEESLQMLLMFEWIAAVVLLGVTIILIMLCCRETWLQTRARQKTTCHSLQPLAQRIETGETAAKHLTFSISSTIAEPERTILTR